MLSANADGAIVWVNEAFASWAGVSVKDCLGQRLDKFLLGFTLPDSASATPFGSSPSQSARLRLAGGGLAPAVGTCGVCEEGSTLRYDLTLMPAPVGPVYESELGATADELRVLVHETTRLEADAKDRALFAEQMVGIVSHDLRNPLSAVSLGVLALSRGDLSPAQRRSVARISKSVGRANRLVADLLDFTASRVGAGIVIRRRSVDWAALISEAVDELRLAYPDRAIDTGKLATGEFAVDADRVAQALGNLVSNAVAYGAPDSKIIVSSVLDSAAGWVRLSVANRGEPIAADKILSLFEPMARGSADGDSRSIGLGLYIVLEIAKAHGGSVDVASSAEGGTVFTVSFHT